MVVMRMLMRTTLPAAGFSQNNLLTQGIQHTTMAGWFVFVCFIVGQRKKVFLCFRDCFNIFVMSSCNDACLYKQDTLACQLKIIVWLLLSANIIFPHLLFLTVRLSGKMFPVPHSASQQGAAEGDTGTRACSSVVIHL